MSSTAPQLFATPATAAAVAGAPTPAILVGGYDGSGNYGDIAQLDAALGLLARLEPGLLLLPVLERAYPERHEELRGEFLHPPAHAIFFDPGEGHEDGLVPVPAPADPAFAACYLYGGGYLNPSWGERKLAMLRAAEALLAGGGAGEICRVASGLQVDPAWIAALDPADAERLRAFELLGARDAGSVEALAALGSEALVLDTSDDAVGLLRRIASPAAAPADESRLRLNVHVAEHEWVTGRPDAIAGFCAELAAELGRRAGRPVVAQPLIAYLDGRVSDRPAVERLASACAERGVGLAEPLVLRPAALPASLPRMRAASLTVSCSYHVAFTSLLLEVPAILLRDNPYYGQKAAGLAAAFDLPASFAVDSGADPRASAAGIAGSALNESGGELRARLALAASRVRERRAAAEVELLARLSGAATAALASELGELGERLRRRSAEPAELLARLSLLDDDGAPPPEAAEAEENGATQARLDEVIGSRSWRMTAPLRRVGRLRRRA